MLSVFLVLFGWLTQYARETGIRECLLPETLNNSSFNYKDWQIVDLKVLKFCLPTDFERKSVRCYDGGCYRFESKDLLLKVDLDAAAWRPTFEKSYPTYIEKFTQVGSVSAWFWHFEDVGTYKYISGANFRVNDRTRYDAGMYVFSKNSAANDIAEKIFRSVSIIDRIKQAK